MNTLNYLKPVDTLYCVLVGLMLSATFQLSASKFHYTEKFNIQDFSVGFTVVDGDSLLKAEWGSMPIDYSGNVPLPYKSVSIALPEDAVNVSIANVETPRCVWGKLPSILYDESLDTLQYNPINLVGVDYMPGCCAIATVTIDPVVINSKNLEVSLMKSFSFDINYELSNVFYDSAPHLDEIIEYIKSIVVNPEDVSRVSMSTIKNRYLAEISSTFNIGTLPFYEYCIVTTREMAPAFRRLVALKQIEGFNAGIVCIEDIYNDNMYSGGDAISSLSDNAGKLREYLRYAYRNGTRYALLGGKPPVIPMRYGSDIRLGSSPISNKSLIIPTDLYFSEFTNNWNIDGDPVYGEPLMENIGTEENPKWKSFSYMSQIYVGRVPCTTSEEVDNYIDKLEIHQTNPGFGDLSYLSNAYMFFAPDMQRSYEYKDKNDTISWDPLPKIIVNPRNELPGAVELIHTVEINDTTQAKSICRGAAIINEINRKRYAYIDLVGHGAPNGITLGYNQWPYYGINALDDASQSCSYEQEFGNGLDNLNNFGYPAYSYSLSCETMPFDCPAIDENDVALGERFQCLTYNFGESFVLGKNYGGFAYLGNTRDGYMGGSTILEGTFFQMLNLSSMVRHEIGRAESYARLPVNSPRLERIKPSISKAHHIRLAHNLYGDPSARIYQSKKEIIQFGEFDVRRVHRITSTKFRKAGQYIEVFDNGDYNEATSQGAVLVIIEPDGKVHSIPFTSNSVRLDSISTNSALSVCGYNGITKPLGYQVQNQVYPQSIYVYCSYAELGKYVYSEETAGSVIIGDNVCVTLDARESVTLKDGLLILNDGKLRVYTPENCDISNVEISVGGVLEVFAKTVSLDSIAEAYLNDGRLKIYDYDKYGVGASEKVQVLKKNPARSKKQSAKVAEMWLEEGYKWTYTMRDGNHEWEWANEDFIRTFSLQSPVEINGRMYFPLLLKQETVSGESVLKNDTFQMYPNSIIAGWMRQDELTGLIYFMPNRDFQEDSGWMHTLKGSFDNINTLAAHSLDSETVCWYGNCYDQMDQDLLPIKITSLGRQYSGYRYPNAEHPNENPIPSYIAYVDGLGLVGVFDDGRINPTFDCGFLSSNTIFVTGINHYGNTVSLLYSIQKGDGTFLLLQEQNSPIEKTDLTSRIREDNDLIVGPMAPGVLRIITKVDNEIEIYDSVGRKLFSESVNGERLVNLQHGVYLVRAGAKVAKVTVK